MKYPMNSPNTLQSKAIEIENIKKTYEKGLQELQKVYKDLDVSFSDKNFLLSQIEMRNFEIKIKDFIKFLECQSKLLESSARVIAIENQKEGK